MENFKIKFHLNKQECKRKETEKKRKKSEATRREANKANFNCNYLGSKVKLAGEADRIPVAVEVNADRAEIAPEEL